MEKILLTTMLTIKILFTITSLEKKKKLFIQNTIHNSCRLIIIIIIILIIILIIIIIIVVVIIIIKWKNKASYHSNLTITYNFNFNVIASCSLVFRRLFATEKHMRKYKLLKCYGP